MLPEVNKANMAGRMEVITDVMMLDENLLLMSSERTLSFRLKVLNHDMLLLTMKSLPG